MISRRALLKSGLATLGAATLPATTQLFAISERYGIVGQQAPELKVGYWIDAKGDKTQFRLADHKGKWVFLKCFQSWCPGCHSHGLPALKQISEALADNSNVVLAGIQTVFEGHTINTVDKVRETQLQYDLKIPMGHDPGDKRSYTMQDYRTGGTPWMILIDPSHKVIFNAFSINADKAIKFLKEQTKISSKS